MKLATVGLLLILTGPLVSLAEPSEVKIGESFLKARTQLILDNWSPIRLHKQYASGIWDELHDLDFKELSNCFVDWGRCVFYYKKNGQCLRLETEGEDVKSLKVPDMSNACPDADLMK